MISAAFGVTPICWHLVRFLPKRWNGCAENEKVSLPRIRKR